MSDVVATIVVPTYGRARQLQACLEALAVQSFREPWEVVVVDDGSPDAVSGVAEAFSGRFDLRVIRQGNAGPAAARNRGVEEARGELVAFTDDDCLPDRAWLETLVRAARERPGAMLGGTTVNGLPGELFASTSQLIVDLVYEHFNADPDNAYFFASNNMLCPRERFLAVGGFDRDFPRAGAEDRDFCDRWRMAGWPLAWRPAARVEHRHSQTLRKFCDLHFRYGRGAHMYQARRRDRGSGTMREDLGFHRSLPRRLRHHVSPPQRGLSAVAMLATLGLWQAANALGFATEVVAHACARRDGRSTVPVVPPLPQGEMVGGPHDRLHDDRQRS